MKFTLEGYAILEVVYASMVRVGFKQLWLFPEGRSTKRMSRETGWNTVYYIAAVTPQRKSKPKKKSSHARRFTASGRNESRKSWAFSHFNGYSSFWLLWWSSSLSLPSRLKPCLTNVPETKKGPMVFLIRSCSFIGRTCFSEFPGAAFVPRCFLYTFLL